MYKVSIEISNTGAEKIRPNVADVLSRRAHFKDDLARRKHL